jgi:hypothetical protein
LGCGTNGRERHENVCAPGFELLRILEIYSFYSRAFLGYSFKMGTQETPFLCFISSLFNLFFYLGLNH